MQCGTAEATQHLTYVSKAGQQAVLHLCAGCAKQRELLQPDAPAASDAAEAAAAGAAGAASKKELNLSAVLSALIGTHVGAWSDELSRLACPSCGIKYMEFRAEGRLGCPHDYYIFQTGLEPLLERIHRKTRHAGKSPRRRGAKPSVWDVLDLRRQLREAVDQEAFERAATLRDQIRQKDVHG
jgi:protein arginine kinase activator